MPSRRSLLAGLAAGVTVGVAGCASAPALTVPRIADQSCPPLDVPADRAVCSHADDDGDIDVSVAPTTVSTASESIERITLRLDNRTDSPMTYDGSRWRTYRNAGFGWYERESSTPDFGDETVEPGGSVAWHGIDAWFRLGPDERLREGLYAAVLPTSVTGQRVVAAFLFRVVRR